MTQEFVLTTDASGKGIGAVLSQMRDGRDPSVAYASALSQTEVNRHRDCAIEKELLDIVWAVKHFKQYLYGTRFSVFTDHKPLTYLSSMNNVYDKLMRFKIELSEYDFDINTSRVQLTRTQTPCLVCSYSTALRKKIKKK